MGSSHGEDHPIPWEGVGHPGWLQHPQPPPHPHHPPPPAKQKPWVWGGKEEGARPIAKVPGGSTVKERGALCKKMNTKLQIQN